MKKFCLGLLVLVAFCGCEGGEPAKLRMTTTVYRESGKIYAIRVVAGVGTQNNPAPQYDLTNRQDAEDAVKVLESCAREIQAYEGQLPNRPVPVVKKENKYW